MPTVGKFLKIKVLSGKNIGRKLPKKKLYYLCEKKIWEKNLHGKVDNKALRKKLLNKGSYKKNPRKESPAKIRPLEGAPYTERKIQ